VRNALLGTHSLERIGNTPLLRVDLLARNLPGITITAKAEWTNPGGSVKDRAAARIVSEALKQAQLGGGVRLLDSTSGNTGIAYAMLGAIHGFGVTLVMPANVSPERKRVLRAYGAEMIFTDPSEGSDGALLHARELAARMSDRYFYADQYANANNWRAHYYGTAEEIWAQTHGTITHFVAALGTSGTFVGTSRRLKELNPAVQCIAVQPDSPFHGLEGLKHMATAIVPKIYDPQLPDRQLAISTEESYAMVKRLARDAGLLVGLSSGTAAVASLLVARDLATKREPAVIVTIFPDSADKYLSARFWEE
jgi:S-sulfo-L-cysteine synthase (O-acetyl-L-serine-dependent)